MAYLSSTLLIWRHKVAIWHTCHEVAKRHTCHKVAKRHTCHNFLWGPTTFKIRLYLALSVHNHIMVDHLNCNPFYLGGDWTSSVPDVIIRMAKDGPTTQECFETVAEKVTSVGEENEARALEVNSPVPHVPSTLPGCWGVNGSMSP